MTATVALDAAGSLDPRTKALAYVAVLAALGMESGMPFHVGEAKRVGATRDEIVSAVRLGLQPAGHGVIACLPSAIEAYDAR